MPVASLGDTKQQTAAQGAFQATALTVAETSTRQTPCTGGRARASVKTTCARKHPAGSSSSACSARWTPLGAISTNAPASCPLGHRPGRQNTHTEIHTTILAYSLGRERTFTSMQIHPIFSDDGHIHVCRLTITITKCQLVPTPPPAWPAILTWSAASTEFDMLGVQCPPATSCAPRFPWPQLLP